MSAVQKNNRTRLQLGHDGNALTTLLVINIVLFVTVNFIKIIYYFGNLAEAAFYKNVLAWFSLSPNLEILSTRPWTPLVYMFTHLSVWSAISSMLWLWWFGYILQDLTGNKKLGPIYVYGGLAGALFFGIINNIFPVLYVNIEGIAPMLGAGSCIMAVAVATTTVAPDYRIFPMINGGIPLWVLTLIFVLIDFALVGGMGAGMAVGHLAGGLVGFVYIKRLQAGHDWGEWMHRFYNWIFTLFEPAKKADVLKIKQEVFYETKGQVPFKKTPNVTQQKIDAILDKIGTEGYHFLSDEEKEYLKRASKDL